MNYLGHLYFSGNDTALMQANLFGDFVKGSKLEHFPAVIREGIELHRKIDHFIDNFPAVRELQKVLREDLPKVSGIAIDIYFDHLLAIAWNEFHPQPLEQYLAVVYRDFNTADLSYTENYRSFLKAMIRHDWMSQYASRIALDRMCRGVSSRLSFPNSLVNGAQVFGKFEAAVTNAFYEYMHAAREHFLIEDHRILP